MQNRRATVNRGRHCKRKSRLRVRILARNQAPVGIPGKIKDPGKGRKFGKVLKSQSKVSSKRRPNLEIRHHRHQMVPRGIKGLPPKKTQPREPRRMGRGRTPLRPPQTLPASVPVRTSRQHQVGVRVTTGRVVTPAWERAMPVAQPPAVLPIPAGRPAATAPPAREAASPLVVF